jgi:ABC-type multidrug transport system ATPase subunit
VWQYLQILRDKEHVSVLVTTFDGRSGALHRLAIMNEGNLVALGTPGTKVKSVAM